MKKNTRLDHKLNALLLVTALAVALALTVTWAPVPGFNFGESSSASVPWSSDVPSQQTLALIPPAVVAALEAGG